MENRSVRTNMVGKKFGRLTVIRRSYPNAKNGHSMWLCECDCGTEKIVQGVSLRTGHTQSCGCLQKEQASKGRRISPKLASMRQAIFSYKRNAKNRGLEYNLTEEQFKEITQRNCHYCGVEPKNVRIRKSSYGDYTYNGIDRVDNDKGYIIGNVLPCCKICNKAKGKLTIREFRDWIKRVYNETWGISL